MKPVGLSDGLGSIQVGSFLCNAKDRCYHCALALAILSHRTAIKSSDECQLYGLSDGQYSLSNSVVDECQYPTIAVGPLKFTSVTDVCLSHHWGQRNVSQSQNPPRLPSSSGREPPPREFKGMEE